MKIKIAVNFTIFIILLSAAWYLQKQQENDRKFTVNQMESRIINLNVVPMNNEISPLNTNLNMEEPIVQLKLFEPFKPREYVRIIESK
ncbi:hypothetical protein V7124_15035 [Neobacillus niacini]|uniref:hypothetical protein n=1 Tax=Neobacillus niacini TaxID=86668 RepID=UPI003000ED54